MYNVTLNIMQSILSLHETEDFLFLQIHKPSVETAERISLNKLYLPFLRAKINGPKGQLRFFPKFEYSTSNLLFNINNHLQNLRHSPLPYFLLCLNVKTAIIIMKLLHKLLYMLSLSFVP